MKLLFKSQIAILVIVASAALAQSPTPAASATASDVAALREQVQALTETVKTLQQQVKDQQTLLEKAKLAPLPQNGETPAQVAEGAEVSSSAEAPFPTNDS